MCNTEILQFWQWIWQFKNSTKLGPSVPYANWFIFNIRKTLSFYHGRLAILQPLHRLTYVTAHSPTLSSLHLRRSSFYNPSFASPTPQALHLRHNHFTYVTSRATHGFHRLLIRFKACLQDNLKYFDYRSYTVFEHWITLFFSVS